MDAETSNKLIAAKIKQLRKQNGLTQQELADRAELTKGYISQLESGLVSPSMITLFDLIECLGSKPSEFFKESDQTHIVYKENDTFIKTDSEGNTIQWLVPSAQRNQMEPVLLTILPKHALSQDNPHNGEEFGFIISGKITVHYGDNAFEAKAGDSFYYEADKIHSIENKSNKNAVLLWISTPPSF